MLTEICGYLRNWFCPEEKIQKGEFRVINGSITLTGILSGQYFRIVGSILNDGVYCYPVTSADGLRDEVFTGEVWPMAVPPALVKLSAEIKAWQAKSGEPSALASESFGGYSYSRATTANGSQVTWQDAYKHRLREWRRL